MSATIRVGAATFDVRLQPPRDVSVVRRLEGIEQELMELTGSASPSPLHELWEASSEYEQAFLRLIASNDEVAVSDVLREYANRGLSHSSGRILAGVTSGITKKLKKLRIPDLVIGDYRGDERIWSITPTYREEARVTFR